jgi:hypothetical protein
VKLENAFARETVAEARKILWREVGFDPNDRKTWTRPVVRLGDFPQRPFRQTVNNELLHAAFDEIVGVGRWVPRASLGGFVVRFPHLMIRRIRDGISTQVFRHIELLSRPARTSNGGSM